MSFIEQSDYDRIMECMPIPCVDVVLVHKGSALMVKRENRPAKGEWWLPGGRIQKGESLAEAACRKIEEEAGCAVKLGGIIHVGDTVFDDGPTRVAVHTINICFAGAVDEMPTGIVLDSQHHVYQWVNVIPDSVHPYIEKCLLGAGFKRG